MTLPLPSTPTSDAGVINRGMASAQYQYVDVQFSSTANADTEILHVLRPPNPEDLDYTVVRMGQAGQIYHDSTATRQLWVAGTIYLRCTAPSAKATILLTVRNSGEIPGTLAQNAALDTSVTIPGTLTVSGLTVTGTGASAIDVAGGINAGSGNVGIVGATGKIPALTSTYITDPAVLETNITDGSVLARVGGTETITGAWTFTPTQTFTAGLKEYGRSVAQGVGTDIAFSAGNFTASSGTWTVASGDQLQLRYRQVGNEVIMVFNITTSTLSATPSELRIATPITAVSGGICFCDINDNGTRRVGIVNASASGYLQIQRADAGNFATATDTTQVRGTCIYEI